MNYWGIDFGTTNSAVFAYIQNPHMRDALTPYKIEDLDGRPFSSVVAISKTTNEVFVGYEAKRHYTANPSAYVLIKSIKMALEDESWRCLINGRVWTAVDVASEIFKQLRHRAKHTYYYELSEAVVAVPNGASGKMKQKIYLAAQKANIKIRQFVTEPTAAFFASYRTICDSHYVVVFDWGGGTLDVTVLENRLDGTIVERAKRSSPIAGDKIDEAIALDIHRQLRERQVVDRTFNQMSPSAQGMLLAQCESAKQRLNDRANPDLQSVWISCTNYDGIPVNLELTRDHFNQIILAYVNNAMQLLQATLDDANLTARQITNVLVVGGSSKLLYVRERIKQAYGNECVLFPKEAEWNIAKGATRISLNEGKSYSAEDIGVILGDAKNSFFPLLYGYFNIHERQALETYASKSSPKKQNFGIMDTTEYPRIVFAIRDEFGQVRTIDQKIVARAYGFLNEQIVIETLVDGGQSFCARIQSDHTTSMEAMYWEYSNMNIVYEQPRFKDE